MSITTPTVSVPARSDSFRTWTRHHLGWLLVALAVVVATTFTTVMVLDDSSTEVAPGVELTGADSLHDRSIVGTERAAAAPSASSGSILDQSITATDGASGSQPGRPVAGAF